MFVHASAAMWLSSILTYIAGGLVCAQLSKSHLSRKCISVDRMRVSWWKSFGSRSWLLKQWKPTWRWDSATWAELSGCCLAFWFQEELLMAEWLSWCSSVDLTSSLFFSGAVLQIDHRGDMVPSHIAILGRAEAMGHPIRSLQCNCGVLTFNVQGFLSEARILWGSHVIEETLCAFRHTVDL